MFKLEVVYRCPCKKHDIAGGYLLIHNLMNELLPLSATCSTVQVFILALIPRIRAWSKHCNISVKPERGREGAGRMVS